MIAPQIRFSIPITLPTLNDMLRMHWAQRGRLLRRVQGMVYAALIDAGWRPNMKPAQRVRIVIYRHSSREPDPDGIRSTAKLLLDVLQSPSKSSPCGLGLIADDSPRCVISVDVIHVAHRVQRTDIVVDQSASVMENDAE